MAADLAEVNGPSRLSSTTSGLNGQSPHFDHADFTVLTLNARRRMFSKMHNSTSQLQKI